MNVVTELVLEDLHDDVERSAPVVTDQILHVLEQERLRALLVQDACNLEEERALRLVFEARSATKGALLGHTRKRERLAWKASEQHVEVGDV